MTVGANLLINFLVFDRLRTPVTVEADILSCLIVFITDFAREHLPKQISEGLLVGGGVHVPLFPMKIYSCSLVPQE